MGEHDQLFKRTFRLPQHAVGELQAVLPPQVLQTIDPDSLELVHGDTVDQYLNERFTDALFRATFRGTTGYIWLLLEHQSEPDPIMPARVNDYVSRSWMQLLREKPALRKLPPVLCVVVHHGEGGWNAPTRLHEMIEGLADLPELAPYIPDFQIIVDDLSTLSDTDLADRPLAPLPKVTLWVLRDGRSIDTLLEHLEAWAAELRQLCEDFPEDSTTIFRYIFKASGPHSVEEIRTRILELVPEAELPMASAGDQLIQEGFQMGLARGEAKGKAEGILEGEAKGEAKGKAEGILAVLSARGLSFSAEQAERITACRDLTTLDRWLRLAVTASSIEQVLQDQASP